MGKTTRSEPAAPAVGSPVERMVRPLAQVPAEDAISRSKRVLAMVDTYTERPDHMNRTALRVALMGEFEDARAQGRDDFGPADMHILRAALADYSDNGKVIAERRKRARAMWQALRME